jgi:hypothetical protein
MSDTTLPFAKKSSTRCLSVITRRAEVNAAKHPGIDDLSEGGWEVGKGAATPLITSESIMGVTLYART